MAIILSAIITVSNFPVVSSIGGGNSGAADIIFIIDTGSGMRQYDPGESEALADALAGVIEQAPVGSGFGVVTMKNIIGLTDAGTAEDGLYDLPAYGGECDIEALLQSAVDMQGETGNEKILVISTPQWYNVIDEAEILEANGITVYIIAFEQDEIEAEEIASYEHAFVCANAKEVSYRIADLYETIGEIAENSSKAQNSTQLSPGGDLKTQTAAAKTRKSSFRAGKHGFSTNITANKNGAALAALLNMYYLMPSWVMTSTDDAYSIKGYAQTKAVAKGETKGLSIDSDVINAFAFYEGKAANLLASGGYALSNNSGLGSAQEIIIQNNINKRIPVLLSEKINETDETYLITGYEEDANGNLANLYIWKAGTNTEAIMAITDLNGKAIRVVDTSKYFDAIYRETAIEEEYNPKADNNVPPKVQIKIKNLPGATVTRYNESGVAAVDLSVNNGGVTIVVSNDENFTVSVKTTFDTLIPSQIGRASCRERV